MASLRFLATPTQHHLPSSSAANLWTTPQTPLSNRPSTTSHPISSYFLTISSLCKQGLVQPALPLLTEMNLRNLRVGPKFYGELLQGCVLARDLHTGQQIHALIIKRGCGISTNEYVETKLLAFYAKCDLIDVVDVLFEKLRVKNVFSWSALIGLYCRMDLNVDALMCFCEMLGWGVGGDNFVAPNVLKACGALGWVRFGRGVHGYVVKMGFDGCVFVGSSLVDMYGKCGLLDDARTVFDDMPERNVVTWNSMILGYVQNRFDEEAINLFYDMRLEDLEPSQVTLYSFLSASANLGAFEEGKQGHAIAVKSGFQLDNFFGSSVINFYAKVGLVEGVELIFSRMLEKDAVTWNLLISSYVQCNQVEKALRTCYLMKLENLRLDSVTLASILSVCAKTKNTQLGKAAHCYCIRNNLESVVSGNILDMYAKCGRIDYARLIFNISTSKNIILCNTLLTAYVELGLVGEALKIFYQMQLECVPLNASSWNALILGFLRNGMVDEANDMFSQMQVSGFHPSLIALTTLISGLVENCFGNEALMVFRKMLEMGIIPDEESIISTLSACKNIPSLLHGRAIHCYIIRHDLWLSGPISTALVDMYTKCGCTYQANRVFDMI